MTTPWRIDRLEKEADDLVMIITELWLQHLQEDHNMTRVEAVDRYAVMLNEAAPPGEA